MTSVAAAPTTRDDTIVPYDRSWTDAWDRFVLAHPQHGPGHLTATLELHEALGITDRSFLVLDARGELAGVMPLVISRQKVLRSVPMRTLSTGTVFPSGPLLRADLPAKRHQALLALVADRVREIGARERVDDVIVSYPPVLDTVPAITALGYHPFRAFGFHEQSGVGLLVDLRRSVAELLANLDGKCRNLVRRAESLGCAWALVTSRDEWAEIHDLQAQTLGELALPRAAFDHVFTGFVERGHGAALKVTHEGRTVSAVVITLVNRTSYYWFGFNDRAHAPPGSNAYALWQAMLHARERGSEVFELGSLEFANEKQMRIAAFKRQFGGVPLPGMTATLQLRPAKRAALDLATVLVGRAQERARRLRRLVSRRDAEG